MGGVTGTADRVDELALGHRGVLLDPDAGGKLDQRRLVIGIEIAVGVRALQLLSGVPGGGRRSVAQVLGGPDLSVGVGRLLLSFVGQLLGLPMRGLRDLARGSRRLGRQSPGLGEVLRGLLDEFLGALLSLFGRKLSVLELCLNLRFCVLALLLGHGFGLGPLAADRLVSGPLRLSDTLLDLTLGISVHGLEPGPPALGGLPRPIRAIRIPTSRSPLSTTTAC